MAEVPANEQPLIVIGLQEAGLTPGVRPGNVPQKCPYCDNTYKIQESTAKTIADLAGKCLVACITCVKEADLAGRADVLPMSGVAQVRRRYNIPGDAQ